jgi:hypothetical protein
VNKEKKQRLIRIFYELNLNFFEGLRLFPRAFFPAFVKSEYSAVEPINFGAETQQPLQRTLYQPVE